MKEMVQQAGERLEYLPPYSPGFSPKSHSTPSRVGSGGRCAISRVLRAIL